MFENFLQKLQAAGIKSDHYYCPYIDFDDYVVCHNIAEIAEERTYSGYRVALIVAGEDRAVAEITMDVNSPDGWLGIEIPDAHKGEVKAAVTRLLDKIRAVGIELTIPKE